MRCGLYRDVRVEDVSGDKSACVVVEETCVMIRDTLYGFDEI